MISDLSDTMTLMNGVKIPGIGFGTYKSVDGNDAEESVRTAIGAGMRHIDCASFYKNEDGSGRGIARGMEENGLSREDLFVTSKVWTSDKAYDDAVRSCKKSLSDLGLEYLDLLLIHWPADDHAYTDWKEINFDTWRAFTDLYKDGLVRSIGVSNFWPEHLEPLMDTEVPPMVDQLEYHPGYMQNGCEGGDIPGSGYCPDDVPAYCKERGIVVEAWSPLGRAKVLQDPLLVSLAEKYGRSTSQICLRWEIQHEIIPLPKSVHEERIIENTRVFDFELDEDDMEMIDSMPITGFSTHTPKDVPW
ncbi:MAG: aldo/keto reductase [Eubacterium sp.]|nr:aldo/keto reductase [Eubacterium sp.]